MTPQTQAPNRPPRVSILARAVPAVSYLLPALGAAVSALLLVNVMRGMRNAEAAGIAAVSGGISQANLAIIVALYLAAIIGIVGVIIGLVRMFTTTTTANPAAWYFLVTGALGLVPVLFLWQAQSLLLNVIFGRSVTGGVAEVANQFTLLTMGAMIFGVTVALILLVSAFVPLPRILRARRMWAPFVILLMMQTAIIAMTVLFHLRTAWLWAQFEKY
jgi:hypothetical protein